MLAAEEKNFLNEDHKESQSQVTRRSFLIGTGAILIGTASWIVKIRQPAHAEAAAAGLPKSVTIVEFSDSGDRLSTKSVDRIVKTESDWK